MESSWAVAEFGEGNDKVGPIPGSVITLEIAGDRVSGSTGVNRYSGSFVDGNLGPIVSTMMAGPSDLMEQEARYLALLNRCDGVVIDGDVLRLSIEGQVVATLRRMRGQLTDVVWHLSGYNNGAGGFVSSPTTDLITAEFRHDGSVTGFGGCNRYRTTSQADDGSMTFSPAMSTRMACPDEKIMEQETRYFALLEVVRSYRFVDFHGRTGLEMYDGDERRILAFAAAPFIDADAGTEDDRRYV